MLIYDFVIVIYCQFPTQEFWDVSSVFDLCYAKHLKCHFALSRYFTTDMFAKLIFFCDMFPMFQNEMLLR